jgi:transcriptional regulator with XRE-family HTH domain
MQEKLRDDTSKIEDNEPDYIDRHIGERLQKRRKLIGMSQQQLGQALGVTFQQIQKYEGAKNRIAASRLLHIAGVLGVSFAWFIEGLPALTLARIGFGENRQEPLKDAPDLASGLPEDIFERKETFDLLREYYSFSDPEQRRAFYGLIKKMKG